MFGILDRYITRELILPFLLGLVVFTFLLMIQPLARLQRAADRQGRLLGHRRARAGTLVPQALAVTIPIALLDRPADRARPPVGRPRDRRDAGVRHQHLSAAAARPVTGGASRWAATSYIMIEAVPTANQTFREIVFGIISARAENEIKPRVFFEDFPNRVLYVGDAPAGGGWRECFLADTSQARSADRLHRRGLPAGDRPRQAHAWTWSSREGSRHAANLSDPAKYEVARFARVDPRPRSQHGLPRHRHPEGRQRDDDPRARGAGRRAARAGAVGRTARLMALHRKFALPVCLLRVGGDRPRPGRAARPRRQAGGLRARHRASSSSTT